MTRHSYVQTGTGTSLVATLVLSTLFFSPVTKAEEDEEFYDDQPYLYYDLHIHELNHKHVDENEYPDFSGSVYMRREYSSEESKKFRELLVKSYKISVLDEQYRTEVWAVINAISNGTKDSQEGVEEISNLTSKYDGQAKMFLDYEIPMDQLITLEMVTWVRDNFEIESMVDGVPRGHMSNRITNVNDTIKNDDDAAQKLSAIEN